MERCDFVAGFSFRNRRAVRSAAVGAIAFWLPAAAAFSAPVNDRAAVPAAKNRLAELAAKMPLRFEENIGQVKEADVRFFARGPGYRLFLGIAEMVFSLDGEKPAAEVVRLRLKGGSERPVLVGIEPLPTKINYLRGNDPRAWHTGVASYGGVRYENVYPGTDVVFSGNDRRVEQSFFLEAGAEPRRIRWIYEGISAAAIGEGGELILRTREGELTADRPIAYQVVDGQRQPVECRYELLAGDAGAPEVGFALGAYDRTLPLVIDPTFSNSTFLGGSNGDVGGAVGVDAAGNVYVAGATGSTDFPGTISPGGVQAANGGSIDGFVAKIDPTGTVLLYSTYLGGSDLDSITGMAVDAAGNVYLTGFTRSTDFPGVTAGSLQGSHAGGLGDAFVAKLNPSGAALLYSTYLGGSGNDVGSAIAFDVSADAYVLGHTDSTDFPGVTGGSPQPNHGGNLDGFVAKIDATAGAIVYATYLGGSGQDSGANIAVDPSGNAVIAGDTASSNFPGVTAASLKSSLTGPRDGFVAKLSPAGTAFVYSTYIGGSDDDTATDVTVDATGAAYVTGFTASADLTGVTAGSLQPDNPGGYAAFVTKINATGTAVAYSTYLGGGGTLGNGIALDPATNAYVTGRAGNDFPIVNAVTLQEEPEGAADGFVAKVSAAGDALLFSTYFGGEDFDAGLAVAVDGAQGIAYVTGQTTSTQLPGITQDSIQQSNGGSFTDDAFLIRIEPTATLAIEKEADVEIADPGTRISYTLTYENTGELPAVGATLTETVPDDTVFRPAFSSPGWSCTPDDQPGAECTLELGTVAPGASGTVVFTVRVKNNVSASGDVIENTACAQPGDQCADAETPTTAAPILLMTKTALFNVARPGNVLDYRLRAFNTGNMDAEPVILTDTVPPLAAFNPTVSTPGWDCEPDGSAGSVCTFEAGTLEAGRNVTAIFAVTLGTQYSNTACVEVIEASPELLPKGGSPGSRSGKSVAPSCATATSPLN
jgi:uncharacterized repeat protein (TIGR01451 family)